MLGGASLHRPNPPLARTTMPSHPAKGLLNLLVGILRHVRSYLHLTYTHLTPTIWKAWVSQDY
ncbi:hypothetical protein CSHISOI_04888 [Colletotrichum shisoi]|uniref:Uncharacterized protein n=1 Tax=Colletotrichum shisoi TaxID=2078593 RepID=A0A5Q4BU39_9PEZI|nr:hypothetical protein CSHISOI_04888 [Colletotrichum shisoi]